MVAKHSQQLFSKNKTTRHPEMYFGFSILSVFVMANSLLTSDAATPIQAAAAAPTTVDTSYWYLLRNDYTTTTRFLDIQNTALQLVMNPRSPPLQPSMYWKFVPVPNLPASTPKYGIRAFSLRDMYSMDVWNDNGTSSTGIRMRPTGVFSGQQWSIVPWGDGSFQLVNDFTGAGMHLDVYSDTYQAFLGTDDHSGQHWHFDKIMKI